MKTNCIRRKRAFTLTELLIVVIVIGVLSAVTLPKFNRVIENRKVTEAEEMMSAVRTEQERRCTLDQNYTTNFSALSDVIASANTKNYTYSLQSQGISARSNGGDYTLKILSYEDGSYCCTGDGCKKLNKNYPDCDTLRFPTSNCAGTEGETTPPGTEPTPVEPEEPECVNGQVTGNQVCNGCGTQTTKACVGGKWVNSLGACSKTAEECTVKPQCPTKPADAVKKCECGTVTASHKCDASTNYTWVQEAFPSCPTKPADVTETCSDGKTVRKKTFTCVNNVWTAGNWDRECPTECTPNQTETKTESCGVGSSSTKKCTRTCGSNGTWGAWSCDDSTCKQYKCMVNVTRKKTGTCSTIWRAAHYTTDMMKDCNAVGLTYCEPGKECDCEVGKNYVYFYMWGCCSGNDKYCTRYSAYNYTCVTCGQVDSLSKCYRGNLQDPGASGGGFIPECSNREDKEKCESCGGTWNTKTCTCDCGFYQGNSCRFDRRRGCVCGSLVRACR